MPFLLQNYQDFLAVILTGLLTEEAVPRPALGYSGIAPGKQFPGYQYVNQRSLLADHSAMMIPSKELMDEIYKKQLMKNQERGFKNFGRWDLS